MKPLRLDRIDTPIGELVLLVDHEGRLCALGFADDHDRMEQTLEATPSEAADDPGGVTAALRAYFDGHLDVLDDIPIHTEGTPFQERVWRALRAIPCGETRTYGEIARAIGQPGAARAIGLANHRNPIALVVPCHRVIGAGGALVGYGAGVERKRWLLSHERRA